MNLTIIFTNNSFVENGISLYGPMECTGSIFDLPMGKNAISAVKCITCTVVKNEPIIHDILTVLLISTTNEEIKNKWILHNNKLG